MAQGLTFVFVVSVSQKVAFRKLKYQHVTDQNVMHEEIKSRMSLGNTCYHSFQNLFLSSFALFNNLKFKI